MPDEMTVTGDGMALEKVGPLTWRYHGVPERDYHNAYSDLWLDPGAYMFSCELIAMSGNGYVQITVNGDHVQVYPKNPTAKRFEVETAGRRRLEFMARYGGEPLDMTFRPSLVRLGDAGGGIANLVGREGVPTVNVTSDRESVHVTPDGVRYAVTNDWSGCFISFDLPKGTYRADKEEADRIIASVKLSDSHSRNDYYSTRTGVDMYLSPEGTAIEVLEFAGSGKIGFVLPQGEGVAHPSIVRLM